MEPELARSRGCQHSHRDADETERDRSAPDRPRRHAVVVPYGSRSKTVDGWTRPFDPRRGHAVTTLDNADRCGASGGIRRAARARGCEPVHSARAYRRAAECARAAGARRRSRTRRASARAARHRAGDRAAPARARRDREHRRAARSSSAHCLPELAAVGRMLGIGAGARPRSRPRSTCTASTSSAPPPTGRLREAPGVGPKTEARILAALERDVRARPDRCS